MSFNGLRMNGSEESKSAFEEVIRTKRKPTPEEQENLRRALASLKLDPTTNESLALPDSESLDCSVQESKDPSKTDEQVTRLGQAFLNKLVIGNE
jgi:hypothetical protein